MYSEIASLTSLTKSISCSQGCVVRMMVGRSRPELTRTLPLSNVKSAWRIRGLTYDKSSRCSGEGRPIGITTDVAYSAAYRARKSSFWCLQRGSEHPASPRIEALATNLNGSRTPSSAFALERADGIRAAYNCSWTCQKSASSHSSVFDDLRGDRQYTLTINRNRTLQK